MSNTTSNTTVSPPCLFRAGSRRIAKRVVLGGRFKLGANMAEHFRKLGWEVFVTTENDVHATAAETAPHLILLPEDAGGESGYLACAKLLQTLPELKVVVVGAERTAKRERLAKFVGASFATEDDGVNGLAKTICC